jgi:hypothetical protein
MLRQVDHCLHLHRLLIALVLEWANLILDIEIVLKFIGEGLTNSYETITKYQVEQIDDTTPATNWFGISSFRIPYPKPPILKLSSTLFLIRPE